jgi:hypothetical protein
VTLFSVWQRARGELPTFLVKFVIKAINVFFDAVMIITMVPFWLALHLFFHYKKLYTLEHWIALCFSSFGNDVCSIQKVKSILLLKIDEKGTIAFASKINHPLSMSKRQHPQCFQLKRRQE